MSELFLYGIIGDSADKLDARTVTEQIRGATGDLDVHINSPGGYVFEGLPIYEALAAYPGKVTVYIDGLAASMASVIAMAGSEIIMAASALMMIHKPWDASIGNADDLRRDASKLDKIEQQLVGIYARRSGMKPDAIAAMLTVETWMTADEAIDRGFATSTSPALKLAAMADVSACGFHNVPDQLKGSTMTTENSISDPVLAERTRVSTITSLVARFNMPAAMGAEFVSKGTPLAAARETILDILATRSETDAIGHQFGSGGDTLDNPGVHAKAVEGAIYARLSGKAPEGASAQLMGSSLVDMARETLELRGVRNVLRMRPDAVLAMASERAVHAPTARGWIEGPRSALGGLHTSSDFTTLLQGAGHRFLMEQFEGAASVLKTVARQRSASDFRQITGVQLGGFGVLETANEAGEFKNGTFKERAESYKLATLGKIFGLSRQAIINDDLGAFADPLRVMARAAAETEAVSLAALINSNPTLADGKALFHADHKNLGATADPTVASLDASRQAMRAQLDLDGTTIINIAPRYVVTGGRYETAVEKLLTPITPATSDGVNVFAGRLLPLVEPRLTTPAWYIFADPASAPALEYAYLNDNSGPDLDTQEGFRVDGTEFRVRLDFGAGVVDHRGAYKNPGLAA